MMLSHINVIYGAEAEKVVPLAEECQKQLGLLRRQLRKTRVSANLLNQKFSGNPPKFLLTNLDSIEQQITATRTQLNEWEFETAVKQFAAREALHLQTRSVETDHDFVRRWWKTNFGVDFRANLCQPRMTAAQINQVIREMAQNILSTDEEEHEQEVYCDSDDD